MCTAVGNPRPTLIKPMEHDSAMRSIHKLGAQSISYSRDRPADTLKYHYCTPPGSLAWSGEVELHSTVPSTQGISIAAQSHQLKYKNAESEICLCNILCLLPTVQDTWGIIEQVNVAGVFGHLQWVFLHQFSQYQVLTVGVPTSVLSIPGADSGCSCISSLNTVHLWMTSTVDHKNYVNNRQQIICTALKKIHSVFWSINNFLAVK